MIKNTDGFTLIEFLVATVILMVGLFGMLQGINLAIDKNSETLFRNEAFSVADEVMMDQRGKKYDEIITVAATHKLRNTRGIQKTYSASVDVATPTVNTKQIGVTVSWKYKGERKNHSVSSSVTQVQ